MPVINVKLVEGRTVEQKRAMADFVIDNSGDLENLKEQTQEFLEKISAE